MEKDIIEYTFCAWRYLNHGITSAMLCYLFKPFLYVCSQYSFSLMMWLDKIIDCFKGEAQIRWKQAGSGRISRHLIVLHYYTIE